MGKPEKCIQINMKRLLPHISRTRSLLDLFTGKTWSGWIAIAIYVLATRKEEKMDFFLRILARLRAI